jgi:hypothetical protein
MRSTWLLAVAGVAVVACGPAGGQRSTTIPPASFAVAAAATRRAALLRDLAERPTAVVEASRALEARLTDSDAEVLLRTQASLARHLNALDGTAWSRPPEFVELLARLSDIPYVDAAAAPTLQAPRNGVRLLHSALDAEGPACGKYCDELAASGELVAAGFEVGTEIGFKTVGCPGNVVKCLLMGGCTIADYVVTGTKCAATLMAKYGVPAAGALLLASDIVNAAQVIEAITKFKANAYRACVEQQQQTTCCTAEYGRARCGGKCVSVDSFFYEMDNCGGCSVRPGDEHSCRRPDTCSADALAIHHGQWMCFDGACHDFGQDAACGDGERCSQTTSGPTCGDACSGACETPPQSRCAGNAAVTYEPGTCDPTTAQCAFPSTVTNCASLDPAFTCHEDATGASCRGCTCDNKPCGGSDGCGGQCPITCAVPSTCQPDGTCRAQSRFAVLSGGGGHCFLEGGAYYFPAFVGQAFDDQGVPIANSSTNVFRVCTNYYSRDGVRMENVGGVAIAEGTHDAQGTCTFWDRDRVSSGCYLCPDGTTTCETSSKALRLCPVYQIRGTVLLPGEPWDWSMCDTIPVVATMYCP